jgi:GntR family transcriptional regulator of abcA and norABC
MDKEGIGWTPSRTDSRPVYRQIADYIREKILSGDWINAQKLPSQRELARIFGVNRSTISEAMQELAALGLTQTSFGGGTCVRRGDPQDSYPWATPDWRGYIEGGMLMENKPLLQIINSAEYRPGIIRLGTGEMSPSLYPAQRMKRVFTRLASRVSELSYLEPHGLYELRRALCGHLKQKGIDVTPANILIVSGVLQALQLISLCISVKSAKIFIESPFCFHQIMYFNIKKLKVPKIKDPTRNNAVPFKKPIK